MVKKQLNLLTFSVNQNIILLPHFVTHAYIQEQYIT